MSCAVGLEGTADGFLVGRVGILEGLVGTFVGLVVDTSILDGDAEGFLVGRVGIAEGLIGIFVGVFDGYAVGRYCEGEAAHAVAVP
jgi:hypothetical protein